MSDFTIFVKVAGQDRLSLEKINSTMTIAELKAEIATKCPDIPVENQRLIYKGQVLKNEKTVDDYGEAL